MRRMTSVSEASLLMITQPINFNSTAYKVPYKTLFKVPYKTHSLTDDLECQEASKQCAMSNWGQIVCHSRSFSLRAYRRTCVCFFIQSGAPCGVSQGRVKRKRQSKKSSERNNDHQRAERSSGGIIIPQRRCRKPLRCGYSCGQLQSVQLFEFTSVP